MALHHVPHFHEHQLKVRFLKIRMAAVFSTYFAWLQIAIVRGRHRWIGFKLATSFLFNNHNDNVVNLSITPEYCTEIYKFCCPYSACIIEEKGSFLNSGELSHVFFLLLSRVCRLKAKWVSSAFAAGLTSSSSVIQTQCGCVSGEGAPSHLITCLESACSKWTC